MSAATKATYVHGPKFGILGVYAIIYLAFVYIPVLFLPLFSFNDSIYIAFPLKGFTFEWYGKMANSPGLLDAMYNSIQVAAIVSVIATVMATLAAKAVTRYRLPGRGPIVAFIMNTAGTCGTNSTTTKHLFLCPAIQNKTLINT